MRQSGWKNSRAAACGLRWGRRERQGQAGGAGTAFQGFLQQSHVLTAARVFPQHHSFTS